MSVDVHACSVFLGFVRVEAFLALLPDNCQPIWAVCVELSDIGEEVVVQSCLLPAFGPPQVVFQSGEALVVGNVVHIFIDLKGAEVLIETGSDLLFVDLCEFTESHILVRGICVDFYCLDDRVSHVIERTAVRVFGLGGGEVGVQPHFDLVLKAHSDHGRPHVEESIFQVQQFERFQSHFDDVECFFVGYVAKLGQSVGDPFGQDGSLLKDPAKLLGGFMGEVVDTCDVLFLGSKLPHFFVFGEVVFVFYGDIVLFHGLLMSVIPFPNLAVAVVEDGVIAGLWKEGG